VEGRNVRGEIRVLSHAEAPKTRASVTNPSIGARIAIVGLVLPIFVGLAAPTPVAPNQSTVVADVVGATVLEASAVGVRPSQLLCVLTLRLLKVDAVPGHLNSLEGQVGEIVTAYSKDLALVDTKGQTVSLNLSFQGDQQGGKLWVVSSKRQTPRGGIR
jgi:hypothetical protein